MGILDAIKRCLDSNSFEDKVMKSIDKPTFHKNFQKRSLKASSYKASQRSIF